MKGKFHLVIIPPSHYKFVICVDDGEARAEHTLSFAPAAASVDHFRTPHFTLQPSHFKAQADRSEELYNLNTRSELSPLFFRPPSLYYSNIAFSRFCHFNYSG